MNAPERTLRALARAHGVEIDFRDVWGVHRHVGRDTVVAVLRSQGVVLDGPEDAAAALRARRRELRGQVIPPVVVAWEGEDNRIPLRLAAPVPCRLSWELRLEGGGERRGSWAPETSPRGRIDGVDYRAGSVRLPDGLPRGYHRLRVTAEPDLEAEALLLAAPARIDTPPAPAGHGRGWGVFVPLYALRSDDPGTGIADVGHLERLMGWCRERGGHAVGLLPVLASPPGEASPYAPLSRRMWDPRHADLDRAAQELRSAGATVEIDARERQVAADLAAADRVDHLAVDELKGGILDRLADAFFGLPEDAPLRRTFERQLAARPDLCAWGAFRASRERHGPDWGAWPGEVDRVDDPERWRGDRSWRRHVYAQWLVGRQWRALADRSRQRGLDLYLDLPLGVPPDSFDAWRMPDAFAAGCSVGAPPDTFFVEGQNWGFAPPHPENGRGAALLDWARAVRHHLGVARALRIDHVMGLHRLWWVPQGATASDGAYVRYHADERFAVLTIEASRAGAGVIGEDLGTVPDAVRRRMHRRGVRRMWILQAEAGAGEPPGVPEPPPESLVAQGTHDMPPFAAWWKGDDLEWLQRLGRLDPEAAAQEAHRRERQRWALRSAGPGADPALEPAVAAEDGMLAEAARLLGPWLVRLAGGPEELLVINLEDLWLETQPQNVPGHTDPDGDLPCWRHRARRSVEELGDDVVIDRLLSAVDAARRESS